MLCVCTLFIFIVHEIVRLCCSFFFHFSFSLSWHTKSLTIIHTVTHTYTHPDQIRCEPFKFQHQSTDSILSFSVNVLYSALLGSTLFCTSQAHSNTNHLTSIIYHAYGAREKYLFTCELSCSLSIFTKFFSLILYPFHSLCVFSFNNPFIIIYVCYDIQPTMGCFVLNQMRIFVVCFICVQCAK